MNGILNFITGRDQFSSPISVNYNGNDTYGTKLGGILTLGVQVVSFAFLVQTLIDLVQMNDPTINAYDRPIYAEEDTEWGSINLNDYRFNLGVVPFNDDGYI